MRVRVRVRVCVCVQMAAEGEHCNQPVNPRWLVVVEEAHSFRSIEGEADFHIEWEGISIPCFSTT